MIFPSFQNEQDFEKVVKYADIVIELDSQNDKALFRKAEALKLARNFSPARDTFENLVAVLNFKKLAIPKDVASGLKECQNAMKNYDIQEKSMYQNMFASK